MIRRYFWAWYWAQSEERADHDKTGWPTREAAIENAKPAELALIRQWGPGKGFRLGIKERWFPEDGEKLQWRALGRTALAVAVYTEHDWKAYIAGVEGRNHDQEAPAVAGDGAGLEEGIARAIFPRFEELPYAR
jgi:hypothetical protein